MLKIAIQKSGRLYEDSIKLLKECGIELNNGNKQLKAVAFNFPLEVYFLRDDDILQYIADGVADIGIVGENVVLEKAKDIDIIYRLGFGRCRLSLAVPKTMKYSQVADLEGLKIATSYSNILQGFERGLTGLFGTSNARQIKRFEYKVQQINALHNT